MKLKNNADFFKGSPSQIDLKELRDYLVDESKTLELVKSFVENTFTKLQDNEANRLLRYMSDTSLQKNVERTYKYAESEIEKIFLNSLNLSAFLRSGPFLLIFTPKFDSATEAMKSFRERDRQIKKLRREFEKLSGEKDSKKFTDFIDQMEDVPEDEKMTIKTHIMMYHDLKFKDAYHLSMQATFRDIEIENKNIRPDIFIWVPSKPDFKLVVECDGFEYHSSKDAFSKDRVRDRILQGKGFQVLRFSGSEIFSDPIGKSIELCEYLIGKKQEL